MSVSVLASCNKALIDTRQKYQNITVSTKDLKVTGTTVTLSQAERLALVFLQSKHRNEVITLKSGETITQNGIPYLHIFNAANDQGFVIIASDSMYQPILAFDSVSNFDLSNINPGLGRWLNKHGRELDYVRNTKSKRLDTIVMANKRLWKSLANGFELLNKKNIGEPIVKAATSGGGGHADGLYYPPEVIGSSADVYTTTIGPLVATKWNQGYPWNQYCQYGSGSGYFGHSPVGCVPMAMGQIMYFWQYTWPASYNFSSMIPKIDQNNSATWPTNTPGGFTESATLLHDIGTSRYTDAYQITHQFADYGDYETGADMDNVHEIFGQFGYTSSESTPQGSQSIGVIKQGVDYKSDLIAEMNSNRPCILSGSDAYGSNGIWTWPLGNGHAWVVDGLSQIFVNPYDIVQYYDQWGNPTFTLNQYYGAYSIGDYLHMNWGWGAARFGGPNNDGWYDCSVDYTSAPDNDANTSIINFYYYQVMIYNIHP